MTNIAIIPARSGSKGLKDKNIRCLNGKPLIAYSIEAALESEVFSEVCVSTDSEEYAEIALSWGAKVPFLRSSNLSDDRASSWDVAREVLSCYGEIGRTFDTMALLQPTSPLRTGEDILAGYRIMKEKDADVVVAVCETEHSPLWSNVLPQDSSMMDFIRKDILLLQRQSMPQYYRVCGALYIVKTRHLFETDDIYTERSFALVLPKERAVDIDDYFDFIVAEAVLERIERR